MTLLSPLALLVGLTAVVPLILHLYQRRRRTVIEFSTNRFFTAAIIRAQRRLRLRRLLLLLLRMATCLLLALALARPTLSLAGFGGGAGTRDVLILLDDSLSMQTRLDPRAAPAARRTRFDLARQAALDVLAELKPGDRAAVVTFTGRELGRQTRSGLDLSADLLQLAEQVGQMEPTFAAGDADAALRRAAKVFRAAAPRNRLLVIVSDLQARDWRQSGWPQPPQPIPAALLRVATAGQVPGPTENVVADRLEFSQGTALVGQPNLLRVRLVNYRPQTTAAELILYVDGRERLRRPIELPGGSPQIERIPLEFDKPGTHRLELRVPVRPTPDALPPDNTLYATITVKPRLRVLLVDGEAGVPEGGAGRPGRSVAFYLRAALRAVSAARDAIQLESVRPADLTAAVLDGPQVVILSAVPKLTVAQLDQLERFVQAGGGLAIFLGAQADRVFYNEVMGAATRPLGGLLPAQLDTLIEARGSVEPLHILNADLDHPILQRFKGTLRSALAGIALYRVYATRPRDAWVLATLEAGVPLLVERSYGRGRVLLCTSAPHPRWSNLPLRRLFVPLCSRLVSYLAGAGTSAREHRVGEDLELLRGGWDVTRPVHYQRPDGTRAPAAIKVVGPDPVVYVAGEQVGRPGFYSLVAGRDEPRTEAGRARPIAVNVPRGESSPETLDLAAAGKLAGKWRLRVIDPAVLTRAGPGGGAPGSLLSAARLSRGLWDTLLWLVFALVLAEPLIANQLIRLRRNRDSGPRKPARRAA